MTTTSPDVIAVEDLDAGFREEVARMPGGANIKKCYACGTCAAGCPVTSIDEEYNCRTIIRQILYGMRKEVLSSPAIWLCVMCYRCYARCPQQVNFTDIMRALRHMSVRDGYASPAMLAKEDEADKKAQMLRREFVKKSVEGVKAAPVVAKKAAPKKVVVVKKAPEAKSTTKAGKR